MGVTHTHSSPGRVSKTPCLLLHSAFLAGGGSWSAALVVQAGGQIHVQDAGGKTVVQADSAKSVSVCEASAASLCLSHYYLAQPHHIWLDVHHTLGSAQTVRLASPPVSPAGVSCWAHILHRCQHSTCWPAGRGASASNSAAGTWRAAAPHVCVADMQQHAAGPGGVGPAAAAGHAAGIAANNAAGSRRGGWKGNNRTCLCPAHM